MTKIISNKDYSITELINKTVEYLKKGKIVIYPTESSYGLGCSAENFNAIEKIYEIKNRPTEKRFPLIAGNKEIIKKYAIINAQAEKLINSLMPGRITLILPKKEKSETIGIRIPLNDFARKLSQKLGQAIIATSANLSGEKPCYSGKEAFKKFKNTVDLIVDFGLLEENPASTVYDVELKKIYRKGSVSLEKIKEVLDE